MTKKENRNNYAVEDDVFERFLQKESYYDADCEFSNTAKRYVFSDMYDSLTKDDRKYIIRKPQDNTLMNENVRIIKKRLDYIKSRFSTIDSRNKEIYNKKWNKENEHAFEGKFNDFLEWWLDGIDAKKGIKCSYCNSTEDDWIKIIERRTIDENDYQPGKLHKSKKGTSTKDELNNIDRDVWGKPNMEIDKINPGNGYYKDNCVFACHLCNNAKSDLVEESDFKTYFKPAIQKYIKKLTK